MTRREVRGVRRRNSEARGLSRLRGVVDGAVLRAAEEASRLLAAAGVPHALVGGLAVGIHGYVRATGDVDLLVGDEAFVAHPGGIVTFNPLVPVQINGVPIDSIPVGDGEEYLIEAISEAAKTARSGGVPVVPLPALVAMKLSAGRYRDLVDVARLLAVGDARRGVARYLEQCAPGLAPMLRRALELGEEE